MGCRWGQVWGKEMKEEASGLTKETITTDMAGLHRQRSMTEETLRTYNYNHGAIPKPHSYRTNITTPDTHIRLYYGAHMPPSWSLSPGDSARRGTTDSKVVVAVSAPIDPTLEGLGALDIEDNAKKLNRCRTP